MFRIESKKNRKKNSLSLNNRFIANEKNTHTELYDRIVSTSRGKHRNCGEEEINHCDLQISQIK